MTPKRRRVLGLAANIVRLIALAGLRNWLRNLETAAPALGSLFVLLLAGGVLGTAGLAVSDAVRQQAAQAAVVEVYLRDDAAPAAVDALQATLAARPDVKSVRYVTRQDVLARARTRPGLAALLAGDQANPFPAEVDVEVRDVASAAAVASAVDASPAVDPKYPSSYDPGAYSRLTNLLDHGRAAGVGVAAFLVAVAVAVAVNSIRAAILARRDEVRLMRLIGSPPWLVVGPFIFEGAFTGLVAGASAGLLVAGGFLALSTLHPVTLAQALPGIDLAVILRLTSILPLFGAAIGGASTVVGLRRARL